MNIEAELFRILSDFGMYKISGSEGVRQLLDIIEQSKQMECDICHKNKSNGIVSFICNDCDANEKRQDYEI